MAAGALLRMLSYHYLNRICRNGPFYLQITDSHGGNLFVDDDLNVTYSIDFEWICALPAETLAVPYWLTGYGIDEIVEDNLCEFDQVRQEFMAIFEEEEISIASKHKPALASMIDEDWKSGAVWFWGCLTSNNARLSLVEDYLCPRFSPLTSKAEEIIS